MVFQFCFAHDTARVVQCLIQYGTPEHRETVFEELKGMLCEQSASPIQHVHHDN